MKISLENIGKNYNYSEIFKNVNLEILSGEKWVILGGNGSGKSTLLQIIAGLNLPSSGKITFQKNKEIIEVDLFYKYISLSAPYIDVIEEFTLLEMIDAHFSLKKAIPNIEKNRLPELFELEQHRNKRISAFSSGMKQRLKLGLAICSDVPILLLDEPLSNLDAKASAWYQSMIENYANQKSVIVCSNAFEAEYAFCSKQILIEDYK